MPRPIQPSAFSYLLPTLVQSGDNTQSSGASGWTPGGALSLQIPDNTVIGGNPRGLGAVDLQTQRTAATQVASGAGSFVAGVNNTASGAQAVAIGNGNAASGSDSVAIGTSNTASNTYAVAIGNGNTASGQFNNSVAIGTSNNVSRGIACIIGDGNSWTGNYNFAGMLGSGNSSQGQYSYIVGSSNSCGSSTSNNYILGQSNSSTSNASLNVLVGSGNASSASNSVAIGISNTLSAGGAAVGTNTSTVNAANSTVLGGIRGTTRSIVGNIVIPGANPISATLGITQTARLILARETTDATPTALASNTSAAGSTNQVILPNNSAYLFTANIIACQTAGAAAAGWKVDGVIRRGANAASTTLVNTATTVIDNTPGWAIALTADTTNGGLTVTVTGASATTIRWVCSIDTVEVTF